MKPPKRWIPPSDAEMRRMFPGWGARTPKKEDVRVEVRFYSFPVPIRTEEEQSTFNKIADEIRQHGLTFYDE